MKTELQHALGALRAERDKINIAIEAIEQVLEIAAQPESAQQSKPDEKRKNIYPAQREQRSSKWTPEMLDELWELREQGTKAREMAEHFHCSEQTIYNKLTMMKKERGEGSKKKS